MRSNLNKTRVVGHAYNHSTGGANTGESRICDHPVLHSEALSQKNK
jgi:hypothetical protein